MVIISSYTYYLPVKPNLVHFRIVLTFHTVVFSAAEAVFN